MSELYLDSAEKLSKKFLENAYKSRDSGSCGELFKEKKQNKRTGGNPYVDGGSTQEPSFLRG